MAAEHKFQGLAKIMIVDANDRKGPSFGKGAAVLLHGVEEYGSLNRAAKELHMAYSKAWSMIKKVEEGLNMQMIERYGARGSVLTEEGREFLARFDEFEADVNDYVAQSFAERFGDF